MAGTQSLMAFLSELRMAATTGAWLDGEEPTGGVGARTRRRLNAEVITAALLAQDGVLALRLRNFIIEGTVPSSSSTSTTSASA